MNSEFEKMKNGEEYFSRDPYILNMRNRGFALMQKLNASEPTDVENRKQLCNEIFGKVGNNFWISPPFYFTYGKNIIIGDDVFINMNCTFLDSGIIEIGNDTLIGPDVKIYTSCHPTDSNRHVLDNEGNKQIYNYTKKIRIGNNVWIGGGSIILGGVSIGDNSVVGAGSVVNRDVPKNVVVVGNPAKTIKEVK